MTVVAEKAAIFSGPFQQFFQLALPLHVGRQLAAGPNGDLDLAAVRADVLVARSLDAVYDGDYVFGILVPCVMARHVSEGADRIRP